MNDHQSYIYHDNFLTFLGRLSSDSEDDEIDELSEDELEDEDEDEEHDYYYASGYYGYFSSIYFLFF